MSNMKIVAFSDKTFSDRIEGGEYDVMLNPEKLQWSRQTNYNEDAPLDASAPLLKFNKTQSEKLSFELVIDCTGVVDSTRVNLPEELMQLGQVVYDYNSEINSPNFIIIYWGAGLAFSCVLTSFQTSYTFFDPEGTALRARVSLEFASCVDTETLAKKDGKKFLGMSQLVSTVEGDTLPEIANDTYRDSNYYVQLAGFNKLDKFRDLKSGTALNVPPLVAQGSKKKTADPGNVVTYEIKVKGDTLPKRCPVHAIHIDQSINRIATATLSVLDGDPATENFAVSASAYFVPGNEITIEVGYDGLNTVLFEGIVTKQALRVDNTNGPLLEVECKDKAVKMTVGRKSANFSDSTDSDVIEQLITACGLEADVSATRITLPTLVQYYATDWDFILSRAEVNGMVVSTVNNTLSVFDPTADMAPALTRTYGNDILSFNAELNAITQLSEVKATAWSFQSQQLVTAAASNSVAGPGNLSSQVLSEVVGLSSYALQTTATETDAELMCWAKAQMLKSELSKITGHVSFQGDAVLLPGKYLTLDGLGVRFDGDHFVSSVQHDIAGGNWVTEASIGLSPVWFTQENDVQAPSAAGLLPGIQGLFNATVLKICDDPDGEFRIQVDVALFDTREESVGVWARMSNFYSTGGQGAFFLPEVGDEVILGFLNQDPRYPVILGSLYSQKKMPFNLFSPNQENSLKGIVSKSELRMLFDDTNKVLSLITPGNNRFVLDDQNKQISVKDDNGNSIVMSASGITVKSDQNISLEAGQKIIIKGDAGIDIKSAAGDVSTRANNISESAEMEFSAKGDMSAIVQGGAELTLKAQLVMIN